MILDEFLIKFGIQVDIKTLETLSQGLEKIGISASEFVQQVSDSLGNFSAEIEQVVQSAEQGNERLTAGLDTDTFERIFGHLGENAQAISEQIDNVVNDLLRLGEQASQGNPEALQNYIVKAEEFAHLTDGLGEAWTAEFGEISQGIAEVALHFSEAYAETLTLANGVKNSAQAVDNLEKSAKNVSQAIKKQGNSASETTGKLEKKKTITQKLAEANKELEKSTQEATQKLGGFIITSLGLEKAKGAFDKLKNSINSVPKALGALTGVLGATVGGLTYFVTKTIDALDGLHQLSQETGESTEYMYRLGKVAETSGSSAEAAQASIKGLSQVIGEAATGTGRGEKAFKQYGLSARNAKGEIKQTSEMLEEIRAKMVGLSQQEKISMLSKLGIDGSMLQTLMKSSEAFREEMERAQKMTLGVGTKEQAQAAADFKDALANLNKMLKAVAEVVALRVAPAITRLITVFENWFVENSDLILNGLELLGDSIAFVIGSIADFIEWVDFIITHTLGWEKALFIVGLAIAWFARTAIIGLIKALWRLTATWLATPFGWVTTALIAIGLLIEDIIVWLQGGESAWGEYYQKIIDGWKAVAQWFEEIWQSIQQWFSDALDNLLLWFNDTVLGIKTAFSKVTDWITAPFQSAFDTVLGLYNKYIAPIIDTISQFSVDGIKGKVSGWFDNVKQAVGLGGNSAKAGAVNHHSVANNTASTVANSHNNTTVNVSLTGSGNSKADAIAIANTVGRTINNNRSALVQ